MDRVWPPTAGYYQYRALVERLPNGRWVRGPAKPVCIAKMVTADPWYSGEPWNNTQDRSAIWYAFLSGNECEIDLVWPFVADSPIDEADYDALRDGLELHNKQSLKTMKPVF